jgi:hypothetical protein
LLFQNLLGSQVMLHIPTRRSPLLLPKAMSQLLYLLFRGHGYLPHEELMREDQIMSRLCAAFCESFLSACMEPPAQRRQRVVVVVNREEKLCEWRGYPFDGTIVVSSYQGGSR